MFLTSDSEKTVEMHRSDALRRQQLLRITRVRTAWECSLSFKAR